MKAGQACRASSRTRSLPRSADHDGRRVGVARRDRAERSRRRSRAAARRRGRAAGRRPRRRPDPAPSRRCRPDGTRVPRALPDVGDELRLRLRRRRPGFSSASMTLGERRRRREPAQEAHAVEHLLHVLVGREVVRMDLRRRERVGRADLDRAAAGRPAGREAEQEGRSRGRGSSAAACPAAPSGS